MQAAEIFTPDSVPTVTYVPQEQGYETELAARANGKRLLVNVFGPSKSGKTALLETVLGIENLVKVSGASVKTAEDLWTQALAQVGAPVQLQLAEGVQEKLEVQGKVGAEGGIPLIVKGKAEGGVGVSKQDYAESKRLLNFDIFAAIQEHFASTRKIIFIDDFHYIADEEVKKQVARQVKDLFERNVKIAIAQVLHRKNDVLKANGELRGRMLPFEFSYWHKDELLKIPYQGFKLLNIAIEEGQLTQFAIESAGSPQLMQQLCLQTCIQLNILEPIELLNSDRDKDGVLQPRKITLTEEQISKIFKRVAKTADFEELASALSDGPKERGRERNTYAMKVGGRGDTYELIRQAIAANPPQLKFSVDELRGRIRALCILDLPSNGQVINSCGQMHDIAEEECPGENVLEWNPDREVLDIADPYLLFYLRHANRQ